MVPLGALNYPSGSCGNPHAGRVFRSDADVVGTPPGEDCFSFYGKAMQWSNWTPHLTKFLTKINNSTKNCSGVVVGGFLGCNHLKSKRTETTHESHLCKYQCLVHMTNAGLFVKLVQGSIKFGSYPAHIGQGIQACPAAFCFCQHHPYWPSRMITTGAVSGLLRLRETSCLLHLFCSSKPTNRSINLTLLCTL